MIPVLSQILMDRESLRCYGKGEAVTWNDVYRRLKLLEREMDRTKPDYCYNGARDINLQGIGSIAELLSEGLCRMGEHYLCLKGTKVYIRPDRFNNWQQICCQVTPLLLQCGVLYKTLPVSEEPPKLREYMYDVLKPNMYYTAIPAPFFPELDSLMKETGGFNDLHLHLNGATETDVLWQHILMDSYNISKNVDDTLKKWPLAKEQAEQEEANFSGIVMYRRLKKASFLRRKIVGILFGYEVPKHDGHPMLFHLGMHPCSTDKFSYKMIHCLSLTAEALMCLIVMRRLFSDKNEILAGIFHEYLLILGMVNRFVVHQVYQSGFDQFQKITMNSFRERHENSYRLRFLQWAGQGLDNLCFVEGRFSPKDTPEKNFAMLHSIINGWENSKESFNNKEAELSLVAHFIKQPDTGYGKYGDDAIVIRWKNLRTTLFNRAVALCTCKRHSRFNKYLMGIDAAANELDTPPEVFAPIFRMLRPKFPHFTYHAGEDFRHILSGLRAMFEAVTFLNMSYGDRLGHGTAAGINANLWMERIGPKVYLPRGEWLDDLIFLRHVISTMDAKHDKKLYGLIPNIECLISELCFQIYGKSFSVLALTEAWFMRQYDPKSILSREALLPWIVRKYNYGQDDIRRIDNCFKKKEIMEIVELYHIKRVRKHYDEMTEVDLTECFTENIFTTVQNLILIFLSDKGIVLESLPTSNFRISLYNTPDEHHLERWINSMDRHKNPPVVLGTDDTGIFCTNIRNEYAHAFQHLLNKGYTPYSAIEMVRQIHFFSLTYRFS